MLCTLSVQSKNNTILRRLMDDDIGLRISDSEGYRGTIRYVGQVEDTNGTWYGIDWDDPSRGKHNGSHNGTKYFWTQTETSGSFVRKEKLNFGISFIEAIHKRYVEKDNELIVKENVEDVKNSMNAPFIELVGFDKVYQVQKSFENLKIVSLADLCVSNNNDDDGEIEKIIPYIEDLDLSKNLFCSWFSIGKITCQLKYLQHLNVSNNKLPVPNETNVFQHILPAGNLQTLTLGNMGYLWSDIVKLIGEFPITCLKISNNKISTLENVPSGIFSTLESLYLQNNNIVDWDEINCLGHLPNLKYLNLANTNLRNIILYKHGGQIFINLEELNISENKLDSWHCVSQLHYMKNLKTLRFTKNPILKDERVASSRDKTIARIGSLNILNGTVVDPQERRGAEYDYMKEYSGEYYGKQKQIFLDANPRYEQLISEYGPPIKPDETLLNNKTNNNNIIELYFMYENKKIKKKVPISLTINKLINLIQRMFNMNLTPILYYTSENQKEQKIQIYDDDILKNINYYNLQQGDTIHVDFIQ